MRHCYQNADKSELIVIHDDGRHSYVTPYTRVCTLVDADDAGGGPTDKIIEKAIDLGATIATHNNDPKKQGRPAGKKSSLDGKKNVRGVRCGKCGETGHNKATCGKEEVIKDPDDSQEKSWGTPLTRKQYADAKLSFHHNMNSFTIAKHMEVDLQEINAVQLSSNYDMYLGRRGTVPD